MRFTRIGLILLLGSGCVWGTPPAKVPFATSPTGATVSVVITLQRGVRSGELLSADSAGVLLRDSAIVRIPWRSVHLVHVASIKRFDIPPGSGGVPARQRRLALVSRFPQGITEPVLAQLLASLKQAAVEELP